MTKALIIVDVQNDFADPDGNLYVQGGEVVAKKISDYLRARHDDYSLIVASRDFHPENLPGHFEKDGEGGTWPVHCVKGLTGSEYHPALATSYVNVHVTKGEHSAAYSAFEGQDFDYRSLEEIFHRTGVTDVDVVGIATDYCVNATATDSRTLGYRTTVIVDLTAAVGGEEAVKAMRAAWTAQGIEVV